MALILVPIFFVSLAYTIVGLVRVRNKLQRGVIFLLGLFISVISLPLIIGLLNGFTSGFIENYLGALWSVVKLLIIDDGDIYMGAGALILVAVSTILLAIQVLLSKNE